MLSGPSRRAICSTCSTVRSIHNLYNNVGQSSIRTFSSSTTCYKSPIQQQERQASTSTSSGKKSQDAAASLSSCVAGTSLSGLNIYKDRADPLALPDDQYPKWLWKILDDSKKTSSGVVLESTEGMTKGEARVAEKRNLRLIRAAHRAKERLLARQSQIAQNSASSNSGAGMNSTGAQSDGLKPSSFAHPESAESLAADAAIAVMDPEISFKQAKKQLRKANRANIKASNFVKSQ